jgi:hypothetical protein
VQHARVAGPALDLAQNVRHRRVVGRGGRHQQRHALQAADRRKSAPRAAGRQLDGALPARVEVRVRVQVAADEHGRMREHCRRHVRVQVERDRDRGALADERAHARE